MHRRCGSDNLEASSHHMEESRRSSVPVLWIALAMLLVLGVGLCGVADYAVSVSTTAEKTVDSGDLVTHVFTVANTGSDPDIYQLDLSLPVGWSALPFPTTISVAPGGQGIVFVNFLVPQTAAAGAYTVEMEVASSFDPGLSVVASTGVRVRSTSGLELEWVQTLPTAQPGARVEGSFRVTNTGNATDLFRIRVSIDETLSVDLSEGEFELAPLESRIVYLRIDLPLTAAGLGQYTGLVVVSSIIHTTLQETLRVTLALGPPPPESVGGSLFPDWYVSGTFSIDCGGEPTMAFRGWGDIEGFGTLNISAGLSMEGLRMRAGVSKPKTGR